MNELFYNKPYPFPYNGDHWEDPEDRYLGMKEVHNLNYGKGEKTMEEKFKFFVAGVKFHQAKECLSRLEEGMTLMMVPEPTNKYDANAVMLIAHIEDDEFMLGYAPMKISSAVSAFLEYAEGPICVLTKVDPTSKTWTQLEVAIGEEEECEDESFEDVDEDGCEPETY